MILLLVVLVFILTIVIQFLVFRKIENAQYPEYYKDVEITYRFPNETAYRKNVAWLAVNDLGNYIWTISDSDIIIDDTFVISWKHLIE